MAGAARALALRAVAALALASAVLLWLAPSTSADSERIASYGIAATVGADGSLAVTETIAYDFGVEQRHGIFRLIPMWSELPDGTRWLHPSTVRSVSMDGGDVPYEVIPKGAMLEVRVGDPDVTISGTHVYELSYDVQGALRTMTADELAESNPYGFAPGDVELYWDFIGTEWPVDIYDARVQVSGPGDVLAAQCFVGYYGELAACVDRIDGTDVTFRQGSMFAYEGLSAVIAYPGSAFTTPPSRIVTEPPLLEDPGRVFLTALPIAVGALLLPTVVVLVFRRRLRGAAITRAPVRFGPPGDLRPAEIAVGLDGELEPRAVVATLLDLVARRYITLTSEPGGFLRPPTIELTWTGTTADTLRPWEEEMLSAIFEGRQRATLAGYDPEFAAAVKKAQNLLSSEAIRTGRLSFNSGNARRNVGCATTVVLVLAIAALAGGITMDSIPLLLGVLPILGALCLGLVIAGFVVPDRETIEGAKFEGEVAGFKRFLDTDPGAARRDLVQRLGLPPHAVYATFLPYAVLFDLEDSWSGAFPDLTQEQLHSTGLYLASTAALHSSLSGAPQAVRAAYTAPQASGGSGFAGGGGFSGGGGGGGGGGSW